MTLRFINHNIASLHCNTDAQRADHHARRMEILGRKGLINTQVGRPRNSEKSSQLPHYADQAAESLGVTRRTVEKDLRRGKKIAPDVLALTLTATGFRVRAGTSRLEP